MIALVVSIFGIGVQSSREPIIGCGSSMDCFIQRNFIHWAIFKILLIVIIIAIGYVLYRWNKKNHR
jgi:hypothetical protein